MLGSMGSRSPHGVDLPRRRRRSPSEMPSSDASASTSGAGRSPRPCFPAVSSSTDEAIEDLDWELARPDFLGDADTVGTPCYREGNENDGGEHSSEQMGEHDGGGGKHASGGDKHGGEREGKHAGEALLRRPHSPTYVEYGTQYPIDWPEQPHCIGKNMEYRASGVESSIDNDCVAHLYRKYETPKDVFFWAPSIDERANQPPAGYVAVNMDTMEARLHFPLHLAIIRLLVEHHDHPTKTERVAHYDEQPDSVP